MLLESSFAAWVDGASALSASLAPADRCVIVLIAYRRRLRPYQTQFARIVPMTAQVFQVLIFWHNSCMKLQKISYTDGDTHA